MLWNAWDHRCQHLIFSKCSMVNIFYAFIFQWFINWESCMTVAIALRTFKTLEKCWKTINHRKCRISNCFYLYKCIKLYWRKNEQNILLTTSVEYVHRLNTESKLIIIYALLIICGFNLLETNSNAREPLLTLARHLKSTSNVIDGWGDGLLGAIGLKKETTSNRYERNHEIKCHTLKIYQINIYIWWFFFLSQT